ncbi:unnamed protein product [Discula destructiva]
MMDPVGTSEEHSEEPSDVHVKEGSSVDQDPGADVPLAAPRVVSMLFPMVLRALTESPDWIAGGVTIFNTSQNKWMAVQQAGSES